MLPTIQLGDTKITRLIIGGNPFSGNSHVSAAMDDEMQDYFTTDKIKGILHNCELNGINAAQMRGDKHIMRILREYRLEGGRIEWLVQTASEIESLEGNVSSIMKYKPAAIYLHGTTTDALFKKGDIEGIKRRLNIIRASGRPVGLCSHMPEAIRRCEEENWGADWYMCCVYNLSRADRVSSAITGKANEDEPFFEEDIPVMYEAIRSVKKPCMAFRYRGHQAVRNCAGR